MVESKTITQIGESLPLMEAFYTIQGEGFHTGKASYFIRLGGCDVGCFWCDVKESWDVSAHPLQLVSTMVAKASTHPARIAVITGGEPSMHPLDFLCKSLKSAGFRTHIETSGAHHLSGEWDWICLSPKKFMEPIEDICLMADELKIIVYNTSDFLFAEKYKNLVAPSCKLFLQPEWNRSSEILPQLIDYVKEHPEWQISLQTHKYMDIP